MRRTRHRAVPLAVGVTVLIATGISLAPPAARAEEPLVSEGPWLRIETEGFTLLGDAPEERLTALARSLECARHFFLTMAGGQRQDLEGSTPTFVYALEDRDSVLPIRGGGFFLPRENRNYAVVHVHDDRVSVTPILGREYVQQLLHVRQTPYPPWLRLGLVELFADLGVHGDVCDSVAIGRYPSLILVVRPEELWPPERLFAITEVPDFDSRDGHLFRYTSWALAHYLILGNREAAARLPDFLQRLRSGEPQEQAFRTTLRPALPSNLREVLVEYLQETRKIQWRVPLDPVPVIRVEARLVDRVEVLFRLGDLLLEAAPEHRDKATRFLQRAVELDPDHGPAHLDLALLAHRKSDPEATLRHAQIAVELLPAEASPERARALGLVGSAILDSLGRRRTRTEGDRARLAKAREALHRALEVTPDDIHLWAELVVAYGLEPKPIAEELEVLEEAMERFPERTDLVSNALLAYGRRGDGESAEALYRRLEAMGADETTLSRGREVLLRVAFFQGDRLIRQGRHEDAIGLFARIQTTTTDSRLRQQVTERIALLERAEEYNRFIDRLLECQTRMSGGDLEGAQALIETLREMAHPGKQTEVVEDLAGYLATLRAEREASRQAIDPTAGQGGDAGG